MTDNSNIQIIELERGAAVKFPFELKDQFRSNFRSAKWNAAEKQWEVGSRSIKRLEDWVSQVNASGVLEELDAADTKRLEGDEAERLSRDLENVKRQVRRAREEYESRLARLNSVESLREQYKEQAAARDENYDASSAVSEQLKEAQRGLDADLAAAAAEPAEEPAAEPAAGDDLHARAAKTIDLTRVRDLRGVMLKNIGVPKAYARSNFKSAARELDELRDTLLESGLDSEELLQSIRSSHGRKDRDAVDLAAELTFRAAETADA